MSKQHLVIVAIAALLLGRTPCCAQSNTPPNAIHTAIHASIACGLAHLKEQCGKGYDGLPVFPSNFSSIMTAAGAKPQWGEGFIGNNAIVLLAMRRAGAPSTDPVVTKLATRLVKLVKTYGVPDTTWDVTWLGAALANMPGDEYAELRDQVLGKLMDGQIDSGAANGLWGPVCINPKILVEVNGQEDAHKAHMATAKSEGKQPDAKRLEAHELLRTFKQAAAQQGDRRGRVTETYDITPPNAPPITVQGLPYSFYCQTFADLETTAYALFALREAKRNGVLPERSWRPKGKTARLQVSPVKATLVLKQAVTALASAQKSDGSWDEHNIHEPRTEFREEDYGQLDPGLLLKLKSRTTATTTAQGLTAILDALEAADGENRLTIDSYRLELERAMAVVMEQLDDFITAADKPSAESKSVAPWNAFFSLRRIERALTEHELVDADAWRRLAHYVVSHQNGDGSWGAGRPQRSGQTIAAHPQASTAVLAWRQQFEAKCSTLTETDRRRLRFASMKTMRILDWLGSDSAALRPVATAFALIFLAESPRPPVAGYFSSVDMKKAPPTIGRAVAYLSDETDVRLLFGRLQTPTSKAELNSLPVLVMPGTAPLDDEATRALIRDYVAAENVLVVELYDSMDVYQERQKFSRLMKWGNIRDVPATAPFLANFRGAKPPIKGACTHKGRFFAIFLQLEAATGRSKHGAMPISKAAQAAYLLIKHRMDPSILTESYLHETPDMTDPFEARKAALKVLEQN